MADIVVGVDGSDCSYQALEWALEEAARRGASLEAVHAWQLPMVPSFTAHPTPLLSDRVELSRTAGREVEQFLARAVAARSGAPVAATAGAVLGRAANVLLDASKGSSLLVVGAHGHSAIDRALLGSVSTAVLNRARTDVSVVRGEPRPELPPRVVVGFDGSSGSRWALGAAAREAAIRGAQLHIVRVWNWATAPLGDANVAGESVEQPRDGWAGFPQAERATDEELQKAVSDLPPVPDLRTELVYGHEAARELMRAADGAQLLVVGSRGLGSLRALLLGSTSHTCVQHAPCPVLVVRTSSF